MTLAIAVFAHVSETLSGAGLETVRAYRCQQRFVERARYVLDQPLSVTVPNFGLSLCV